MPRRTTVQRFPFLEGQHQEIDPKILPEGYLSACKNVRLRKDGRFGVRADFDAIGNDTCASFDLVPRDVIGFGDELCALGDTAGISGDTAIWNIADYTGGTPAEWAPTDFGSGVLSPARKLSAATNLRTIPSYSAAAIVETTFSCTRVDCAAAGGVVCLAYESGVISALSSSRFRFIRSATGATILEVALFGTRPRVVAVGTTFWFTARDGNSLRLSKFNPATDADQTPQAALSSSSFSSYDLATNFAGNGFWVVMNKTTPTTTLTPYDSSGVAGAAITGPAVLYSHVSIRETATRVHLVSVLAAGTCQLRSYTTAGALSTGPTTITANCDRQPGIADSSISGREQVDVYAQETGSPPEFIAVQRLSATTHNPTISTNWLESSLAAKPVFSGTANIHSTFGVTVPDGSFFSTALGGLEEPGGTILEAYTNKFAASKTSADHTPQIGRDASTGKLYWPTLVVNDEGYARPLLTEFDFAAVGRRQTAQIAGMLHVGGGALGVYDGRVLTNSGFFEKPRIISATPSNGAGSLPSLATLLVAVLFEARDSAGRVVYSDISDVTTVTMGAADDTITIVPSLPHGFRYFDGSILCVAYRSISGINQLRRAESAALGASIVLLASDATVRTHGVIYTQAGRAALGAILPHESPIPSDRRHGTYFSAGFQLLPISLCDDT